MINSVSANVHVVMHETIKVEIRPVPDTPSAGMVTVSIQGVNEVGVPAVSLTVTTVQQAEALGAAFNAAARRLALTW